jgi:HTH-type transcriptional regulator/antitoxin HigA
MTTERVPAEVFPPGEFLRDELEARGWTQTEFAEILGRPLRLVNEILAGKRGITRRTAREIAAALDTTPELWLNLETAYRLSRAEPVPERILGTGG